MGKNLLIKIKVTPQKINKLSFGNIMRFLKKGELKNLKSFWLIDPIDGTHDYINGKEEFTINAGLILNKKPVAGIINAPDKKRLFFIKMEPPLGFEPRRFRLQIGCSA